MIDFRNRRTLAPEDGAGGGAPPPPAAAPSGDGVPPPPAGQTPAAPPAAGDAPPAAGYRPEGLPDHFAGASDKETIDKLFKAVDGFRKSQAERGEVPDKPDAYTFTPAPEVAPYVPEIDKDPFYQGAREDALAAGLTNKQFDTFLNSVMKRMVAGNMMDDPFNPDTERQALFPDVKDPAELAKQADKRIRDNAAWIDAMKASGLPDGSAKILQGMLDRADGVKAVEYFRTQLAETKPSLGGDPPSTITHAMLKERMRDPRNTPHQPKYDPAFANETARMYKALFGG